MTRPEALLLLTVEGQSTWARTRQATEGAGEDVERWETELEARGILFIENDGWVGSTHPEFYHSTIHAPWYVLEHWGELFDVEAYLPDGSWSQDLVVLRRRADEGPSPRPPIKRRLAPTAPAKQAQTRTVARPRARFANAFSRLIRWGLHRIQARLGDTEGAFAPSDPDAQHLIREVGMLRLGLYEHGKRISVLAEQLRDEIKGSRQQRLPRIRGLLASPPRTTAARRPHRPAARDVNPSVAIRRRSAPAPIKASRSLHTRPGESRPLA